MLKGLARTESRQYEIKSPIKIEELKKMIKGDFPSLSGVLDSRSVLISVNQEFATRETVVKDGDEVGLLPPFSGG
ncbi:MAG: MoaD/ThiS family protein [Deltaproteobacteria bacterium]|nr:MoaD/ThiS family protein [Deltaproteobacteria bacterium]